MSSWLIHWVAKWPVGATSLMLLVQLVAPVSGKSCHLRELDLCLASVLVFAQAPQNNKVTENDINKQCHYFGDTESCFKNYTSSCATTSQRLLIDFVSSGVLQTFRDYCTPGNNMRKLYVKHGECLNIQRPKTNKCLIDLQAAIEKSTSEPDNHKDRPKALCCAYDRNRACMASIVEPACGKEAVELGETFVRAIFSRAVQISCSKYKHTSSTCKALLPPKGTIPKGPKSNSVLSRLMSTVTGIQWIYRQMKSQVYFDLARVLHVIYGLKV